MKISESKKRKIEMLWNVTIVVMLFIVIIVIAYKYINTPKYDVYLSNKLYCENDLDCVCGGIDISGDCFIGNKIYYKQFVDKSRECPDFCNGIANNLEVKCIKNKCTQVNKIA